MVDWKSCASNKIAKKNFESKNYHAIKCMHDECDVLIVKRFVGSLHFSNRYKVTFSVLEYISCHPHTTMRRILQNLLDCNCHVIYEYRRQHFSIQNEHKKEIPTQFKLTTMKMSWIALDDVYDAAESPARLNEPLDNSQHVLCSIKGLENWKVNEKCLLRCERTLKARAREYSWTLGRTQSLRKHDHPLWSHISTEYW